MSALVRTSYHCTWFIAHSRVTANRCYNNFTLINHCMTNQNTKALPFLTGLSKFPNVVPSKDCLPQHWSTADVLPRKASCTECRYIMSELWGFWKISSILGLSDTESEPNGFWETVIRIHKLNTRYVIFIINFFLIIKNSACHYRKFRNAEKFTIGKYKSPIKNHLDIELLVSCIF